MVLFNSETKLLHAFVFENQNGIKVLEGRVNREQEWFHYVSKARNNSLRSCEFSWAERMCSHWTQMKFLFKN